MKVLGYWQFVILLWVLLVSTGFYFKFGNFVYLFPVVVFSTIIIYNYNRLLDYWKENKK